MEAKEGSPKKESKAEKEIEEEIEEVWIEFLEEMEKVEIKEEKVEIKEEKDPVVGRV